MPQRHRRLTMTKSKPKTPRRRGGDPNAPTWEMWKDMVPYQSFIVTDKDNVQHKFAKGDVASILPFARTWDDKKELVQHDFWIGKIREIKAKVDEDETNEVWVDVQWYYSGSNVGDVIKSFDVSACGKYERVKSDHHDFVSSEAFNDVETLLKLNERNPYQEYIRDDVFYQRHTFEVQARKVKFEQPQPGSNTCTCNKPYSPDDKTTLMHFCPRPSCRKWYHSTCLLRAKSKERRVASWEMRLLVSSPDSDDTLVLEELVTSPPKKRQRRRPSSDDAISISPRMSLNDALELIPDDVLRIAQQPIVKGHSYKGGGIVGNVNAVACARKMVYDALSGTDLPDDWRDVLTEVGKKELSDAIVKLEDRRTIPAFICPQCEGAI
ncbi:hypothetical protein BDQ12DRAFT_693727 [Crucibulum laeve]|uniref:BAH domain-containing protein n=1 Tax=Crucibulum laeve TaxID=68775 RepID=A0A5C3LIG6_9AGAR|nr:hypothetical protein BDQ12DRAFT_693727 [Crucibulum laeve]